MAAAAPGAGHYDPNAAAARASHITRFKVYGRVRPFIDSELEGKTSEDIRSVVEMTGSKTVLLDPKEGAYTPKAQFDFDDSLWSIPPGYKYRHTYDAAMGSDAKPFASQEKVYQLVAKDAPTDALEGFNTAVLTYGQTGSGKTYTMMGSYDPANVCGGDGPEGIIPRVCHDMFQLVERKRAEQAAERKKMAGDAEKAAAKDANKASPGKPAKLPPEVVYSIEVTFVEIYMEKVRDLLDPALRRMKNPDDAAAKGLMKEARIRQDPVSGPFIENLTKYRVESWAHCCTLLERGLSMRKTCANVVHQQSSRSHAIFTVTLVQQTTYPPKDKYGTPTVRTKSGRINLGDLAGSERGGFTDYVKESANINKSLLSLRCVIDKLLERQQITLEMMSEELKTGQRAPDRALPAVPFRDSVLTWLLSDSMGGNARTSLIAALSPHEKNFGDTLSTLQWSSRARGLVSVVKVNDTQSQVQSGLQTKVTDLGANIKFANQSVDALRNELTSKEDMIGSLERGSVQLMRANVKARDDAAQATSFGAAMVIKRGIRQAIHRMRQRRIGAKIDDASAVVAAQRETHDAHEATATIAAEAREEADDALEVRRQTLASDRAELEKYRAERESFDAQHAMAQRLHSEGEVAMAEVKEQLKAALVAQQAETDAAVSTARKATERRDTMQREIADGQAMLEAYAVPGEEERVKTATDAAEKRVAELEARVKPLRDDRDKLLERKRQLQERLKKAKK